MASPGEPGARPSNASEATVFTIADILAGSIGDVESALTGIATSRAAVTCRERNCFRSAPSRIEPQLNLLVAEVILYDPTIPYPDYASALIIRLTKSLLR